MYKGFEIVEEEIDFVIVEKDQQPIVRVPISTKKEVDVKDPDYKKILNCNKIATAKLTKIINKLETEGLSGHKRELWIAAANCVIKCMSDVIEEGEKMLATTD
jgi:hypothetical protein